jgi:hypothetical protein
MGRTACTEPQCLYKGALFRTVCTEPQCLYKGALFRTACTEPQCLYKGALYRTACTEPECLYKGAIYFYLLSCQLTKLLQILSLWLTSHCTGFEHAGLSTTRTEQDTKIFIQNQNNFKSYWYFYTENNIITTGTRRMRVRNRDVFPYINNSMRYGSSWEPVRFSASKEIPRTLRNRNVHYRFHKRPPMTLSWSISIHSKSSTLFLEIRFLILSYLPMSSILSPSLTFPHIISVKTSLSPHVFWSSYPPWLDCPNSTCRWAAILKLLLMQSFPLSCFSVPFTPKSIPNYPILEQLQPVFFL